MRSSSPALPPAFCAGANLGNLAEADGEQPRAIYEGFLRIARSPLPTLAAVNGAAVGAGMNLALGCDVRLAARRAKFDTRFLQIGLHPGGGHTWMLRRIAGPQATMAAVVFGEVMDGAEAERVGLVHRCVDDDQLLAAAQEMAARAASAPRELAIETKKTIQAMADIDDAPRRREARARSAAVEHPQPWFAERIAALQAKISSEDLTVASDQVRRKARTNVTQRVLSLPLVPVCITVRSTESELRHPYVPASQGHGGTHESAPSRPEAVPPPKMDLRAHAHNERHRIHSELERRCRPGQLRGPSPTRCTNRVGPGCRSTITTPSGPRPTAVRPRKRHWKMKMWKRRTNLRKAKAKLLRLAAEQPDVGGQRRPAATARRTSARRGAPPTPRR